MGLKNQIQQPIKLSHPNSLYKKTPEKIGIRVGS